MHARTHRYFEIIEIVRKLVMASLLIFVYEGTSSQIVTGFMVTLVALLLSLWLRPFNDDSLQNMHEWSLFVQTVTLLAGVMIKTDQFTEILGETGGQGRAALGGIIISLHFLVTVTPMLDKVAQKLYIWHVSSQRDGATLSCCSKANIEDGDSEMDTGATLPYRNYEQKRQQLPPLPIYTQVAPSTLDRLNVDPSRTKAAVGASAAALSPSDDSDRRDAELFPVANAAGVGKLVRSVSLVMR